MNCHGITCSFATVMLMLCVTWPQQCQGTTTSQQHCDDEGGGDCVRLEHSAWTGTSSCDRRQFGWDSFACRCSGSSCDAPGPISPPSDPSSFLVVTSSRGQERFGVTKGEAHSSPSESGTIITINPNLRYQTILGFGGAITDSAGLAVLSLSPQTQDSLLRAYFSPQEGIGYNMVRLPIAGTDFSSRPYSYDDVPGDLELEHFALTEDDLKYKIPLVKRAQAAHEGVEGQELLLFASPWAPPYWMKTNGQANGTGSVLPEMWQAYSDYIVRFIDAYAEQDVRLWGLTSQNEPLCGLLFDWPFNACLWLAEHMRDWIAGVLGPSLEKAGHGDIKLIISDQGKEYMINYTAHILANEEAARYVDGIGVHWYMDNSKNVHHLSDVHGLFPDQFLLYTEACTGYDSPPEERVKLGDWGRAEQYAASILEATNHFSSGWVDWNIALNMEGGPNWVGNFVDSPIIVDAEIDSFYKQPMFYAMGHFSKFVQRGSQSVYNSLMRTEGQLKAATFLSEDSQGVAVLLNTGDEELDVSITPGSSSGLYYNFKSPARSIQTILFTVT